MGDDRVNVVFFHAYPHQYAGAQRLTHALARELAARGHTATIVLTDDGPYAERLRSDGTPFRIVPAPAAWRAYGRSLEQRGAAAALGSLPRYWLRVARWFRRLDADVVHINDHRGVLLAGVAARFAGKPVVWHLHGSYPSRAITMLGRLVARRIVVVSEATRAEQVALPRGGNVEVLHNGLVGLGAKGAGPPRANVDGKLVVTGARHHPDKGLDVLIRAAAIVRKREPGLRIVIAGTEQPGYEGYSAELHALTESLGLHGTVDFAGYVPDPLRLWRSADVYVQPSRREPFGLGVVEAMSVGTPVVTTAVGGMVEIVEAGRAALQVRADDPEALAGAIEAVLADDGLATSLAESGRARAADFSMDRMVDRLLAMYREAEGGSR
jgi:glycosyltransferase involved in cell wall biosynthesis